MSRIGKLPIPVPSGVDVTIDGQNVSVKGPKGDARAHASPSRSRSSAATTARCEVKRPNDERRSRALHGLTRTLVDNMVVGVTEGYEKKLEIHGVGYRVAAKGSDLEFALGFTHPVHGHRRRTASPSRSRARPGSTSQGIDKQQVGEVAANIRKLRKPDPYKGKGVRYAGEKIRRKVGKTGK